MKIARSLNGKDGINIKQNFGKAHKLHELFSIFSLKMTVQNTQMMENKGMKAGSQ